MAYEKLNLSKGTVLKEAHLAHIEQGIADAEKVGADAVLYTEQTLTDAQKGQARANIEAVADIDWYSTDTYLKSTWLEGQNRIFAEFKLVRYDADQTGLTEEQKAQARTNIGAAAIGEGGGGTLEGAVLYTEQTLTDAQKQQACENIGTKKTVVMTATLGEYTSFGYGGEYAVENVSMTYDEVREAVNAGAQVECHVTFTENQIASNVLTECAVFEQDGCCLLSCYFATDTDGWVGTLGLEQNGNSWFATDAFLTARTLQAEYLTPNLKQSFTEEQKAQGRANLGIDEYIDHLFLGGAW